VFTKITVIGICVGAVILGIGIYAFVSSPPWPHTKTIDETIHVDNIATYEFTGQKSSHQNFKVTGESFHVKLQTPGAGIQNDASFKNEIAFDWFVLEEGVNKIMINNTGQSELRFRGTFEQFGDQLYLIHNVMLITTGIVIIGFSGAFSVRKPKGF
jgi:hypothetical protein